MNYLDTMKTKSNIAKHKANVAELEFKIAEKMQDVDRIKENMNKQLGIIEELENELGE